ncbi:MAG: secretin N-terminal domain-containing protein [Planctomycetota bacterium]|jgi:general secretion pathway protein D
MRTFKLAVLAMMLALASMLTPGHTTAQQAPDAASPAATEPVEVVGTNGDVKIKLNFQDTPLQAVLEYLSETVGLTVVSSEPLVDGRMTVISRQAVSLDEAVTLINSILKEKGLTTVLTGKVLKVVTVEQAKTESLPVYSGRDPEAVVPSDDMVTYVIPVRYVTADALRENLETLIPEHASLEANEDGNALIVTDTTANIQRLMKIVAALDTHMATVSEIRVFRLVNADAASAAQMINTMFEQNQQGGRSSRGGRDSRGGPPGGFSPMRMMMERMRGGGFGGRGPGGFGGRGGGR